MRRGRALALLDHFHYYRGTPSILGTVPGSGEAVIATSTSSTTGSAGVFFPETGEAVLLDVEALSKGEVRESFRLELAPHDGLVVPLGVGGLVTVADAAGRVTGLQYRSSDGTAGDSVDCVDASGAITTRVGLVVGCADGAVLDTRARTWTLVPTSAPVIAASAADDEAGLIVAVDAEGRVRVLDEAGAEQAVTDPLIADPPADAASLGAVQLSVDAQRAYVSSPADGRVYELAYADGARVARTFDTPVGASTEVGR